MQLPRGPRRGFRAWVSLPPRPVVQTPPAQAGGVEGHDPPVGRSKGAYGLLGHPCPSSLPGGVGRLRPGAGGGEVL